MTAQINLRKRKSISELLAVVAIILLILDTANTFTSQGGNGFLHLTDRQSGIYLGLPSVFLFFASFGIGFRQKTRLTASLLMAGGALLAVTKIIPGYCTSLCLHIADHDWFYPIRVRLMGVESSCEGRKSIDMILFLLLYQINVPPIASHLYPWVVL
jgi:hypothetical protein